jgi:penicillin-binding protein 1A
MDNNSNNYRPMAYGYGRSKSRNDGDDPQEQQKVKKYVKMLWGILAAVVLGTFLMFAGFSLGLFGFMPSFDELENPQTYLASEIYSVDSALLGTYYIENRSRVSYRDISPELINALIATEDVRFRKHSGIDVKALGRVFFGAVTVQDKGGGSTITQQLAKNLFPRDDNQNFLELAFRKFKEWVIAVKLERHYSKDEIITMYLNKFDFLNLAVGIKSAARIYFSTAPANLDLLQSATLVGMVKNPSLYNPVRRPDLTLQRRNTVLRQMVKYGYLEQAQADTLFDKPLDLAFQRVDHNIGTATYFKEYLRGELMRWCSTHLKPDGTPYDLYRDGLRIYTTIDSRMQKYAEEAVTEHMGGEIQPKFFKHWKGRDNAPFVFENNIAEEIDKIMQTSMRRSDRYRGLKRSGADEDSIQRSFSTPIPMTVFSWDGDIDTVLSPMDSIRYYKFFLNAGLMSIDPPTGQVRAYVGGIDYRYFKYDHVVQSKRQVGSTFKPFLYTLAMQEGAANGEFSPCTEVPNIQVSIELPDGTYWSPRNSSDEMEGQMVTLKYALAHSINWVSAYLMKRFSPQAVIQMARKMGITADIPAVPAIALGTPDISLYEMVGAMNTFVNDGIHVTPYFITHIEDKYGNIIEMFHPESNEAMDEQTAYLMLNLMQGVVETGTGRRLRYFYGLNNEIAGKTGTTQNQSDGWFMGLTPQLTTGVWVGAEERSVHFRTIEMGQGARLALPIWGIYMKKVYADTSLHILPKPFPLPSVPITVPLDCENQNKRGSSPQDIYINSDEF